VLLAGYAIDRTEVTVSSSRLSSRRCVATAEQRGDPNNWRHLDAGRQNPVR
jgi:hypothetical protein